MLICLSWNIAGWGRRCGTTEFTNYIQRPGHAIRYPLQGYPGSTKQSTTRRPKGGLACMVSTSLKVGTVELHPCGSLALALLIKRGCNLQQRVALACMVSTF
ncbi:hypothetical protein E2320_008052 [Naja naja]|nr:hypothetical protein E2320_008052 [Naja naja]